MKIWLAKPDITDLEINAVIETMKSWQLGLWPKLKIFEEKISIIAGTKFASAVCNWTCWLHLIVKALEIWPNDAVFVPSFTFIASANCFVYEWAYPIFIDIEPDTYNLDIQFIEKYIKENTEFTNGKLIDKKTNKHIKWIVGVHVFGHPFDIDPVLNICKKYNLYLIEDAAEAIWSQYKWHPCGQFWEASIFAFYPNKQITTGEWGIITTNNQEYFTLFESLKNQGRSTSMQRLTHERIWYNYRLSDINASIWIVQTERLNEIIEKRENVAKIYTKYLWKYTNLVKLPIQKEYCTKLSRFVFVVEILTDKDINIIINDLHDAGIQSKNYFSPIHLQKIYMEMFGTKEWLLPVTEKIAKKTLSLPFFNTLSEEEIKYICEKLIYSLS